jgi:hypothetical protein
MGERPLREAALRDLRNRANEGSRRLESRRRAGQTGASSTSARMHSQRQGALKRQLIKSSFSGDAKNCLTRYGRSYSVRSACGPRSRPIRAEAWGIVLDGSAMRVKLRDNSRHRNASSAAFTTPTKIQPGLASPARTGCCRGTAYDIMAIKTGPHAVSRILPIA